MIFLVKKVAELLINPAFPYKHNIGADYLGRALNTLVFTDESKEIHTQELFLFIDRGIIDTNCNLPIIQNCEKRRRRGLTMAGAGSSPALNAGGGRYLVFFVFVFGFH